MRQILEAERASKLFSPHNEYRIHDNVSYEDTWVYHFLSMAMERRTREQVKDAFQNVTVINFNYDRTIEHFLFSRLQTNFGADESEAVEAVSNLAMIRPYGSIGPLRWQAPDGIPFGHDIRTEAHKLFDLATNVRTYTEQISAEHHSKQIQSAIAGARIVVFLGFGFHQQNITLLQGVVSAEPWRRVFATVLGIDAENYEFLKLRISQAVRSRDPETVKLLFRSACSLLQTMRPSILIG